MSATSAPTAAPSLRRDATVISLVGFAHGTSHFFHFVMPPLFPWLMRDFGLTFTQAGATMTVFFVVSGIGQALAGFVVDRLGAQPHRFAYQSAAMTPDPWLGPDAGTELDALVAAGSRNVLVAPVGFTCEHVEVLYDLDIELRRRAEGLGARLERIEMVGHHPAMMAGLADRVRGTAAEQGWL